MGSPCPTEGDYDSEQCFSFLLLESRTSPFVFRSCSFHPSVRKLSDAMVMDNNTIDREHL
ncbi:hypothetical protein C4D60_Mb04t11800 [Musa balbisiana]|uniref:Uncharacterized protein n=1 Tax=Musa balbisiana TaxID=52838 RepID=A0A4S8KBF7_MUSBA|nr:hypothetical protein C4D60_Mb04t11800 [Musa balbisiana]